MKKIGYLLLVTILAVACSTSDDSSGGNNGNDLDLPQGVQLIFPHQNSLCNEGVNQTETESTVFFEWEPSGNAQSYLLTIESLDNDDVLQFTAQENIYPVTINRGESYKWFVEYTSQGDTKTSAVWNFYNAADAIQNYAPFAAEIVAPTMAQNIANTNSIILQWNGSDVDNDIVGYDVYFGTDTQPALFSSDITQNQIEVSVTPGNIYYWSIITKDTAGNSSQTSIHQFRILE